MTKRKAPEELKRRGRKAGADNEVAVWIAVELRRRRMDLGRARASLKRSCEYVAADLVKHTSSRLTWRSIYNRYHRVEARRRADPRFAEALDHRLDALDATIDAAIEATGAKARLLPLSMIPN